MYIIFLILVSYVGGFLLYMLSLILDRNELCVDF